MHYIKTGKWGFKNANEEEIVKCTYDYVTEFNRYGFAGIKNGKKWGAIDENGNVVLECKLEFEEEEEVTKPEFIGKFYKVFRQNGEVCYTDEIKE